MNEFRHYDGTFGDRHYIGSSDIGCICGVNPWQSPLQLWRMLTGRDPRFEGNERTEAGHIMEPVILSQWMERAFPKGKGIKWLTHTLGGNLIFDSDPYTMYSLTETVNPDNEHNLSHADLLISSGENLILEAKNTTSMNRRRDDITQGYDFKDLSSNGLPMSVFLQVQNQLHCYGVDRAVVCVLVDGWQFLEYPVERNDKLCQAINKRIDLFWQCVETDTEPEPETWEDCMLMWPKPEPKKIIVANTMEKHAKWSGMIDTFEGLNNAIRDAQKAVKKLKPQIQKELTDAEALTDEEGKVILKRVKSGTGWSYKKGAN